MKKVRLLNSSLALLVVATLTAFIPTESEAICCHSCMYHPKGGNAFSMFMRALMKDFRGKNVSDVEKWNIMKYYGPFCTLNTCDELIAPLLNRCRSMTQVSRKRVIMKTWENYYTQLNRENIEEDEDHLQFVFFYINSIIVHMEAATCLDATVTEDVFHGIIVSRCW